MYLYLPATNASLNTTTDDAYGIKVYDIDASVEDFVTRGVGVEGSRFATYTILTDGIVGSGSLELQLSTDDSATWFEYDKAAQDNVVLTIASGSTDTFVVHGQPLGTGQRWKFTKGNISDGTIKIRYNLK